MAKIKCSICSYQFNIWYTGNPVTILNEFFRGASQKAVLARQGARMASGWHCITGRSPLQHQFAQSTEVVIERFQTQLNSCAVKIPRGLFKLRNITILALNQMWTIMFVNKDWGVENYSMNRPFRKSVDLLIEERTSTRAHSRRHSAAVFYLNIRKSSFSRCPRSSLQSCCDRLLRNCFMTQRSASSFWPRGRRDCSMERG